MSTCIPAVSPARPVALVGLALFALACGGDPGAVGDDAAMSGDTTAAAMTTADPATDGSTGPSSAGPEDTGMMSADASSDGTGGEPGGGYALVVVPSSRAVTTADEGGTLTVACHVTLDGVPVVDVAPTVTLTPNDGVYQQDGVYTFESFGLHTITCDVEIGDEILSATSSVAVLNEIIDPTMATIGQGLGGSAGALFDIVASNGQDDQVLVDAVARLGAAGTRLAPEHYAELDDVLRHVPGDYYPTPAEIEAMGIAPTPDDAMLEAAIDELDAALADLGATVAGFDPAAPTEADAAALAEHAAAIEAAVTVLVALEPSAHGLMATRTRVADLVRERVAPTTGALVTWADARIRAEADVLFTVTDPAAPPLHFGLLGLTLGMFGDSYLQVRLLQDWYGDYIDQLDESFNNFILADAIDYYIELGEEPPTIDYLIASASIGFATPGYPSWIDGFNFAEQPERNLFLVFGDSWQGIIDAIISGCGLDLDDTLPERFETLVSCLTEIEGAVDSIFWTPDSVGPGQYGSQQGLDMGEFPEVCGGGLPTATFVVPISWENGRGPSYFINCI